MYKTVNNPLNKVSISKVYQVKHYFNSIIFDKYHNKRGFHPLLSLIDIATIIHIQSVLQITTLKGLYMLISTHYREVFTPPCYKNFVRSINLATPYLPLCMVGVGGRSSIKIIDSTPLPVCRIQREKRHKTMKLLASKSHNGQYWYYGMKLHILIEPSGSIINARITTASIHDTVGHTCFIPQYKNTIYIADMGYLSSYNRELAALYNSSIYTPYRSNMKCSYPTTKKQQSYKRIRKKVETTFSLLKTRYNLVSTLPRSINGTLAHYIRSLFMYQWRDL